MLSLAAQLLRIRKGSALATLLALVGGVVVLMACGLLVESGLQYSGAQQRYAAATVVVADRNLTLGSTTFGERESTTVVLPERASVPASLVAAVGAVPGVAVAVGDVAVPLTPLSAPALPALGHGWGSAVLAPYDVLSGAAPRRDGEIAVDSRLAAAGHLQVGGTTELSVGGDARPYQVSGIVRNRSAAGTTSRAALFFTDAQAAALATTPGRFDAVGVLAAAGADRSAVVAAVRWLAADAGAQAYAGDRKGLVEQPEAADARELVVQAGTAFGGYAALIVGFVVAATVGLSVRHRRRELALLRAVGATPGQVRRLVLGEVALLTLLAAVIGIPLGLLATAWTRGQLVGRGFVPDSFRLSGGLLAALAAVAGITVVALVSGYVAARRTASIRPSQALGEVGVEPAAAGRVRLVLGLLVLAAGGVLIGLTGGSTGQTALGAAVGTVYAFVVAVALLAPWINAGAARLLTPVLPRLWGNSGHLAAANLRANARGTVAVLTALVLAVGFGGTVWFLQDNLQRQTVVQSHDGTLAQSILVGAAGLPAVAAAQVRAVPGVLAATAVRRTSVIMSSGPLGPVTVTAQAVDVDGVQQTLALDVTDGSLADLRADSVALSRTQADASGVDVGQMVDLWLGDGTPARLRLAAVYQRGLGFGDVTLSRDAAAGHTTTDLDDHVLIRTAPGTDTSATLTELADRHPGWQIVTAGQLGSELSRDLAVSAWLNTLLTAVLIGYAALAAANTLIMGALARTRELSLLRLVGMTRRQIGRMVHAEQAGLLGVALALGGSIAAISLSSIVHAVAGQRIPYVPVAGYATILGGTVSLALVATILPVRRVMAVAPVQGMGVRE